MKVRISKEFMLSTLVILPYIEGGYIKMALRAVLNDRSYIPMITFLMLAVWIAFLLLNVIKRKRLRLRPYAMIFGALWFYSLITVLYSGDIVTSLSVWIWLCVPMVLSLTIIHYCRVNHLDYGKIVVGMIYWFTLYSILLLINDVIKYGLFSDASYRMHSRAGGAVIYGYTVAVFFSLCLCYKKSFPLPVYYMILGIFTLAVIATGCRGAFWPVAGMWVFNFVFERITRRRIAVGAVLVILLTVGGVFGLNLFSVLSSSDLSMFNRLVNLNAGIRGTTLHNVLSQFCDQNPILSIFGYGLGNFFPYQHWALWIDDIAMNTFMFNGRVFLVQPHNSFAYILVETGLVGFVIWCSFFVEEVKCLSKRHRGDDRRIYKVIFVCVVIFVNLLDSVLFVQSGIAMVYWLLLLLVYEDHERKAEIL